MTMIIPEKNKCAICHTVSEYGMLASTNTFGGSPDLDLRPPEMKRSTMPFWIQECPECGYISDSISDESSVTKEWLQSEKYLTCDGIGFLSDLAQKFYRHYLICLEDGKIKDAFFAILHAAWACDDQYDAENAKRCREMAISLADKLLESDFEHKNNLLLMKVDLMRRAGQFDELVNQYASIRFKEELLNQILDFEMKKAKEEDISCYRVENVTGRK